MPKVRVYMTSKYPEYIEVSGPAKGSEEIEIPEDDLLLWRAAQRTIERIEETYFHGRAF